jgi:hypothetical protein
MFRSPASGRPSGTVEVTGPAMPPARLADRLADTLLSEARLLVDLAVIMQRQRDAVAIDDLDGVDESVFATHRVLTTLGEARRRRRSLAQLLGESDDLSLSALESFFNGAAPENVRSATERLSDAARTLQREVDLNRRVLRRALEASDKYVRSLCGIPAPGPVGYPDSPRAPDGAIDGNIVDRRI